MQTKACAVKNVRTKGPQFRYPQHAQVQAFLSARIRLGTPLAPDPCGSALPVLRKVKKGASRPS